MWLLNCIYFSEPKKIDFGVKHFLPLSRLDLSPLSLSSCQGNSFFLLLFTSNVIVSPGLIEAPSMIANANYTNSTFRGTCVNGPLRFVELSSSRSIRGALANQSAPILIERNFVNFEQDCYQKDHWTPNLAFHKAIL